MIIAVRRREPRVGHHALELSVVREVPAPVVAHHQHVPQPRRARRFDRRHRLRIGDDDLRARVVQVVLHLFGLEVGVHGADHAAGLHRAEPRRRELGHVGQHQQHALLLLEREAAVDGGGAVDLVGELLVRDDLVLEVDRRSVRPRAGLPVEKLLGEVELLGQRERVERHSSGLLVRRAQKQQQAAADERAAGGAHRLHAAVLVRGLFDEGALGVASVFAAYAQVGDGDGAQVDRPQEQGHAKAADHHPLHLRPLVD
jgi:hypothetical protein